MAGHPGERRGVDTGIGRGVTGRAVATRASPTVVPAAPTGGGHVLIEMSRSEAPVLPTEEGLRGIGD